MAKNDRLTISVSRKELRVIIDLLKERYSDQPGSVFNQTAQALEASFRTQYDDKNPADYRRFYPEDKIRIMEGGVVTEVKIIEAEPFRVAEMHYILEVPTPFGKREIQMDAPMLNVLYDAAHKKDSKRK